MDPNANLREQAEILAAPDLAGLRWASEAAAEAAEAAEAASEAAMGRKCALIVIRAAPWATIEQALREKGLE